ncbi:hypothetical protein BLOT_000406 [Blomia tropicalis]|nr:hypothetical protein BLOT_000406 [Blomia tropicalis]
MNSNKPEVPSKPSRSKFFVSPSNNNSFSKNVHSILVLNSFVSNKPSSRHQDSIDNNSAHISNNSVQMDTVSESGFKLSGLSSKLTTIGSLYRNRRKPRSQSININPTNAIESDLSIDGAMFFLSYSNGLCGNLSFSKKSILFKFGKGFDESQFDGSRPDELNTPRCPLKEVDSFKNCYEIDFLNIGNVYTDLSNEHHTVMIFCRDFRHVKILMRQCEAATLIIDRIKRINFDNISQINREARAAIWEYMFNNYQYVKVSDWQKHEHWVMPQNVKIDFSHFNDVGHCSTLPEVVIVPRNVNDTILNRFISISNGNRIPVISYLHRPSGNVIIRSTTINDNSFQDLFGKHIIYPIRELAIDLMMQELGDIDRFYGKLRKYSFNAAKSCDGSLTSFYDYEHSKQFWSKCGPWLVSLAKVLKVTASLVKMVSHEASIALIETFDSRWNCVLSSLVQLIVDPYRRTIEGFESLISKEWVFLQGYKSRIAHSKFRIIRQPDTTLFVLFLDVVHQLIIQNPHHFQFTSIYLILLMDLQFMTENYRRENSNQFELDKQHILHYNPFYRNDKGVEQPRIIEQVSQMKFFYALYFRHIKSDILKHTPEERIFINQLHNSSLI